MYKAKKNRQVMEAQVADEAKVSKIFGISFLFLKYARITQVVF